LFTELADSKLPQVDLLDKPPARVERVAPESLEMTSRLIEKKLSDFGVEVRVVAAQPRSCHRYEIEPATGVQGSQGAQPGEGPGPFPQPRLHSRGRNHSGQEPAWRLELPNAKRQTIQPRRKFSASQVYNDATSMLAMAPGREHVHGQPGGG